MTRYAPLWQQNNTYPAGVDRELIATLWPSSASTGGQAATVANTMNVQLQPGTAAVALTTGNNSALCRWDATEVVTLSAAPVSGQSRIDLIVLQVRDVALDAGANNDFIFQAIAGTPVVSGPVPPALPANAYAVCQVLVIGGSANLNGATITDVRAQLGSFPALPPVVTSGTTVQSFTDANGQVWVAKAGVNGGAWRLARDVLHCVVNRTAAFNFNSGPVPFDTVVRDPYGIYNVGTAQFIPPVSGMYFSTLSLRSTTSLMGVVLNIGASGIIGQANLGAQGASFSVVYFFNAGQLITHPVTPSGALVGGGPFNFATFDYVGTG